MLQSILSSVTFRVPIAGASAWTRRNKKGPMVVKKPAKKKKAAKIFKGERADKSAGKKKKASRSVAPELRF